MRQSLQSQPEHKAILAREKRAYYALKMHICSQVETVQKYK